MKAVHGHVLLTMQAELVSATRKCFVVLSKLTESEWPHRQDRYLSVQADLGRAPATALPPSHCRRTSLPQHILVNTLGNDPALLTARIY